MPWEGWVLDEEASLCDSFSPPGPGSVFSARQVVHLEEDSVLQHTKEHCLMGRKGRLRRSTDSHFIHCNVDVDVIVSEEPPHGRVDKPVEVRAREAPVATGSGTGRKPRWACGRCLRSSSASASAGAESTSLRRTKRCGKARPIKA